MNKVSTYCSLRPLREKVAESWMRGAVTGQPLPDTQGAVVGQALPDNAPQGHLPGFTLIELLVVVIIIAILAAIAVPQYKHAVLKSRFSTVMPMAKAIADAQEVYYQGRQLYALDVDELDVTPVNAENTSVTLSQTDGYDYVMAQNSQVPGANYIIYQKYSENYPSEIHCEAEKGNADAEWLCSTLSNNNKIGVTLTRGYDTYLMKGSGMGLSPWANAPTCDAAEALGYICSITTNEAGEQVKKICTNGVCRTNTYNEDGGYTSIICMATDEGMCYGSASTNGIPWISVTYDANGNMISKWACYTVAADGSCQRRATDSENGEYKYDANGNMISTRQCGSLAADGTCLTYSTTNAYDYTYDANGNMLTQRWCRSFDSDGSCTEYNYGSDKTYDAAGRVLTERYCSNMDSDGNCTTYSSGTNYTYSADGTKGFRRTCSTIASNGNCTAYSSSGELYTYDSNGNKTSQRICSNMSSNGTCTSYSSYAANYDYMYDTNGNLIAELKCIVDNSGNCTYSTSESYYYDYDANGNRISQVNCKIIESDASCSEYGTGNTTHTYIYDDNGNQIARKSCYDGNLDKATGKCVAYNVTNPRVN